MNARFLGIVSLILAAAFSRLIPHPWNFTAIGAMALFGGTYVTSKRMSLLVPMAALFLSDLILGLHNTMFWVYGAFALIVMLGWTLKGQSTKVLRVGGTTLLASLIFFAVSNFGVWIMGGFYPPTVEGLISCFVAAIPFFGNQVAGDFFFVAMMFGAFEALKKVIPQMSAVRS